MVNTSKVWYTIESVYSCVRDSGVSWGRRVRGAGARGGVAAGAGGGAGAGGAGAGAWRRRERAAQPRRPMEILTSIYALLSGGVSTAL